MGRKPAVADNGVVDDAILVSDEASASIELPPYIHPTYWDSEDNGPDGGVEGGVGVIRVNVNVGGDGIILSSNLESDETGFQVGSGVKLNEKQALKLSLIIQQTVLDGKLGDQNGD